MNLKIILTLLSSIVTFLTRKNKQPKTEIVKSDVQLKDVLNHNDQFFIELGSKYFDNWIYGEPIVIDPQIRDVDSIYLFLKGFNNRMTERGSNDKEKMRERIDLLYQLATLIRNVDGVGPSSTGEAIGQTLSKLRIIDGARFDREVLKILPKEKS